MKCKSKEGVRFVYLCSIISALVFFGCWTSRGGIPNPGDPGLNLDSWSFADVTNWVSDLGYAPLSFSNISYSLTGDGTSLVVDTTNPVAWLQYNLTESSGTNEICLTNGTIMFWFAPNWISATNGGSGGPGTYGFFVDVGGRAPNGDLNDFFCLHLDPGGTNIYFETATNNAVGATCLTAPINWFISNYWHHVALTYGPTNSALYIDGTLVTNGLGVTYWPSAAVLTNGWFLGSDFTGVEQVHGSMDNLITFNYCLDSGAIGEAYLDGQIGFLMNPLNFPGVTSAPFNWTNSPTFRVVAGAGYLQDLGAAGSCATSPDVWLTNVSAVIGAGGTTINFAIAGGTNANGLLYDVFGTGALSGQSVTNSQWAWLGQGATCRKNALPDLANPAAFLILGWPTDSDGDGLSDAFERLVSKTDPTKMDTFGGGLPDGWVYGHFGNMAQTANGDFDQDGMTNLQEYLAGTDPVVPQALSVWVSVPATPCGIP